MLTKRTRMDGRQGEAVRDSDLGNECNRKCARVDAGGMKAIGGVRLRRFGNRLSGTTETQRHGEGGRAWRVDSSISVPVCLCGEWFGWSVGWLICFRVFRVFR